MMTLSAFARASTVSSTDVSVIVPVTAWSVLAGAAMPPNRTLVRDRFMATH